MLSSEHADHVYDLLKREGYSEVGSIHGCYGCAMWQGHGNPAIMPYNRELCRFIAKNCEHRKTILIAGGVATRWHTIDKKVENLIIGIKSLEVAHI